MQDFQHVSVLDRHQINVSKALLDLQREIELTICQSGNIKVRTICENLNNSVTSMLNYECTKDENFSYIFFLKDAFSIISDRVKDIIAGHEKKLISQEETFDAIDTLVSINYKIKSKLGSELCITSLNSDQSLKLLEIVLKIISYPTKNDVLENCKLLNNISSIISFNECSIDVIEKIAKSLNDLCEDTVNQYSDFLCSLIRRSNIDHSGFLELITSKSLSKKLSNFDDYIRKIMMERELAGEGLKFSDSFGDILVTIKDSLKAFKHGSEREKEHAGSSLNFLFYEFLEEINIYRGSSPYHDIVLNLLKSNWQDLRQDKFPMMMHVPFLNSENLKLYFLTDTRWDNLEEFDDQISISITDVHVLPDIHSISNLQLNDEHKPDFARFADVTKYFIKTLQSDAPIDLLVKEDFLELNKSTQSNGRIVCDLSDGSKIIFLDLSHLRRTFESLSLNEYFND